MTPKKCIVIAKSLTGTQHRVLKPLCTVCLNGHYADISNQHQVQQSFDTEIKATTTWQTSNFLIRDGRTRKKGVTQAPPILRKGYPTLTEGRAVHAYQIINCPPFKTCHLPFSPGKQRWNKRAIVC